MRRATWIFCCLPGMMMFSSCSVQAQTHARALGMGGAYTAVARGVHAADWNPANLGLPDNPGFTFSFISAGVHAGNNSFQYADYKTYNGTALSKNDVRDILDLIPDNGFKTDVDGYVHTLSFSVRRFAVTLGGHFGGHAQLDKSLFEIALRGNALNQTYMLEDMDGSGMGVGFLGFSYGHPFDVDFADHFALGLRFNLVYGAVVAETQKAKLQLATHEFGFALDGHYEARAAGGGLGWDVGLGAAADLNEKWTVSLGFSHLIGTIPWNRNVRQVYGFVKGDTVTVYDITHQEENALTDSSREMNGADFSKPLPIVLKAGVLFRESDYLLTADYIQGFAKGSGVDTTPQLSLGTEWRRLKWLPLRAGVILGGRVAWASAFGFGLRLGPFAWDFAIMNRGFITNGSSKGVAVATELGLNL